VLPIAFGLNIDFLAREVSYGAPSTQWWIQLSTAIVFGLSFATILTLVVTPASLAALAKLRAVWDRMIGRRGDRGAGGGAPAHARGPADPSPEV
jgi:multidrug efflux pump